MTTYNTGNPVPSTAVKDLYDNSQTEDEVVNSDALTTVTRTGKTIQTFAGMKAEFDALMLSLGYVYIGDYDAVGELTFTLYNQIMSKDGDFWKPAASLVLPYTTVNNWVADQPKFVSVGDAILRQALAASSGSSLVGHIQSLANAVARTVQAELRDAIVSDQDFASVPIAFASIGQASRPLSLGGRTVTLTGAPVNTYGVPIRDGKLLVPSTIVGFNTQLNTYADQANGIMIGRENLAAFWKACTAGTLQNIYLYGDSTVETGGAYPFKPHELFKQALYAAGVNNCLTFNRGLSGTSWSDFAPTGGDIGTNTKLIIIKYGINDATKANALQTYAADARAKLTALRASANGDWASLSILLMGPNSTYRPSQNQDAKWYESLRDVNLQLVKEFDLAYFDTYAYLQSTKHAPGFWLDNIAASGEGIHPDPVAVYWIWREALKTHVLGDGQWNISKANQFWNINNYTRVASSAVTPAGYDYGVIVESALTANGFPFNGILTTIRHSDGVAIQRLHTQDVVPRTTERRGGGAVWTQWSGVPTAITGLNSWVNKGGGYATAGFQVGADGFVDLYGVLAGGAAASTVFTLPTNARPAGAHEFRLASTGTATLFADGNFIVTGANTTLLSLDGIRFRGLN